MLPAMFNLAHIVEKYFTSRSIVDVKELKDNHPDFALVLEVDDNCLPQFSNLNYKKIPVCDIEVGSNILVRAGETVAVDGEVIQGASTITIEHLTAESEPREKAGGYNSRWCKKPWRNADCQVSRGSIYRALGLMVAASPCALAVAPLAYATAISSCASKGILLKAWGMS